MVFSLLLNMPIKSGSKIQNKVNIPLPATINCLLLGTAMILIILPLIQLLFYKVRLCDWLSFRVYLSLPISSSPRGQFPTSVGLLYAFPYALATRTSPGDVLKKYCCKSCGWDLHRCPRLRCLPCYNLVIEVFLKRLSSSIKLQTFKLISNNTFMKINSNIPPWHNWIFKNYFISSEVDFYEFSWYFQSDNFRFL